MTKNFYISSDGTTYRHLPAFEEKYVVMGGCIVVERSEDTPQTTTLAPSGMFDSRFGTDTGRLAVDDLRYER